MRRAFTLIELLIVIGIVAIIAAILFPVFASAREDGRKTTCLSNQRQLGLAMQQYLGDWGDHYPSARSPFPGSSWVFQLYRYVNTESVYKCPTDPFSPKDPDHPAIGVSYAMNMNLGGCAFDNLKFKAPSFIQAAYQGALSDPAKTVQFFEVSQAIEGHLGGFSSTFPIDDQVWDGPLGNGSSYPSWGRSPDPVWESFQYAIGMAPKDNPIYATGNIGGRMLIRSEARHRKGANYVLCDGHVTFALPQTVSSGRNSVDPICDQGTVTGQLGTCATQDTLRAAGTSTSRYKFTFSGN